MMRLQRKNQFQQKVKNRDCKAYELSFVCIIAPVTPAAKKLAVSTPVTASKNKKKDSSSDSDSSDDNKKQSKVAPVATKTNLTPSTVKKVSSSSSSDSEEEAPVTKKSPTKSDCQTFDSIFTFKLHLFYSTSNTNGQTNSCFIE
jgi:hypothetical protein